MATDHPTPKAQRSQAMRNRHIDNDALASEIARQRAELPGDIQIHTRSQQRLDNAQRELADLTTHLAAARQELRKTEANLAALTELATAQRAVETDLTIEAGAVEETIHALRQAGVSL